jgi:hypothetical protein
VDDPRWTTSAAFIDYDRDGTRTCSSPTTWPSRGLATSCVRITRAHATTARPAPTRPCRPGCSGTTAA